MDNENKDKSIALIEAVKNGEFSIEDLERALEALKTEQGEAEPKAEDAEKLFGMKFVKKQGE